MKGAIKILYVEDNEDYIEFVKRAIRKIDIPVVLESVTDGNAAVEYLDNNQSPDKRPGLILLDINLPGITGIELIQKIRRYENMTLTPVVMFSTSDNPADVKKSYGSGANAYVIKPMGIEPLANSLKSMYNFWINFNYSKSKYN